MRNHLQLVFRPDRCEPARHGAVHGPDCLSRMKTDRTAGRRYSERLSAQRRAVLGIGRSQVGVTSKDLPVCSSKNLSGVICRLSCPGATPALEGTPGPRGRDAFCLAAPGQPPLAGGLLGSDITAPARRFRRRAFIPAGRIQAAARDQAVQGHPRGQSPWRWGWRGRGLLDQQPARSLAGWEHAPAAGKH